MTRSDSDSEEPATPSFGELSKSYVDGLEQTMEVQQAFVESWMDTVDETFDEEVIESGVQGSAEAYEVWMDAAESTLNRTSAMFDGDEVTVSDFREIWLDAANEAFKKVMTTEAFAAMTGESLGNALEIKQQVDAMTEDALHDVGLVTRGDLEEVGERLVELERRQHAVEQKLDSVLNALDASTDE